MRDEANYQAWLCLKTAPEIGFRSIVKFVETYGDPTNFVGIADHDIYRDPALGTKARLHLQNAVLPQRYQQIQKLIQHYDIRYSFLTDADYPEALKAIFSPPPILYYRGDLHSALKDICLAVVGTRKPGSYGSQMCKMLLQPVVERGVCIISGLAMGIDTISHHTALEAKGKTVAVLACGVENIYPPMNRELAKHICNSGALISEYEPGSKMEKWNFPARNRIISALSEAVFIVEGAMSSGALLTAKFALEQGRDILALPGNINVSNAQGPNYLIKTGALAVTCSEDILRVLGLETEAEEQIELFPQLSETEQSLYEIFKKAEREVSFDELIMLSGASFGKLSIALLNLELKGLIGKSGGSSYLVLR